MENIVNVQMEQEFYNKVMTGGGGDTSSLFLWFITSDDYASNYDFTEEEFQAMVAHNAEVYKLLDAQFKSKGCVRIVDLVGFAYDGFSYYGRRTFMADSVTAYVLSENSPTPENWGQYNYGDTVIKFNAGYQETINREIYDTLCPDGRFYYQRTSGGPS